MRRTTLVLFGLSLATLMTGGAGCERPDIRVFVADPATITPGQTSNLSWVVLNASELRIDQGVGDVFGQTGVTVSPTTSTTYTLTATNRWGAATQTATVAVLAASHALTVGKDGFGQGTVSSSPAGIDCGPTCSAQFPAGTTVTMTAAPSASSGFGGWGGACSGTGPCTVTMDAAKSVTATFHLQLTILRFLGVGKAGTGQGLVVSNPAGIDCGTSCSRGFASGTAVTLTAAPASGSAFAGWSGACTGSGSCAVTMDGNRDVTATFVRVWSIDGAIHAPDGGPWGEWGPWQHCPSNSYADAFRIRVQPPQGSGDDTALNGIQLLCRDRFTTDLTATIASSQGTLGDWSHVSVCVDGLLAAYRLKVETPMAGDNTAANSLMMACRSLAGAVTWQVPSLQGPWGTWRPAASAPSNTAICGIQTRVEPRQSLLDNTALNDVRFAYCTY
jgi:hypothetical protein